MLRDIATEYYIKKDCNCAEAVLMAANEQYNLCLGLDDIKLVSGFGGGMGCGSTCGALAGSIAALGRIKVSKKAHQTAGFGQCCGGLVQAFEEKLGATDCETLVKTYKTYTQGCVKTVQLAADVLEQYMESIEK